MRVSASYGRQRAPDEAERKSLSCGMRTFPPMARPDGPGVRRYPRNADGRDFVVGDLHGMYAVLERALAALEFDPGRDRLFSVGDLIDRGEASELTAAWLAKEWFHPCRGNHDQLCIDAEDDGKMFRNWTDGNGGEWWFDFDEVRRAELRTALRKLPYVLEVETAEGMVGIVHADVPRSMTWQRFRDLIGDHDPDACLFAIWSREWYYKHGYQRNWAVEGVSFTVCGHTPVDDVVRLANRYYIDTACVYVSMMRRPGLTLLEIHPNPGRTHFEPSRPKAEP